MGESAAKSAAADAKVTADRRAAAVANGLEEARALLETADRQRRAAEQELADTNETLADLTNVNQSITASKRKLEGELGQLNADLDEMTNEAKMSEDKAARAMVDAARLADELRCEQELAMNLEKDKKLLEAQCKDAATRADEAEVNALKGGRKAMIKMETRIRELESELDAETRRFGDINKNLRKSERSIKELTFAGDEDRKNHERMQALIDQLQGKVKSYRSRSRRPRRSPPSTWPSTARSPELSETPRQAPMPTSRQWRSGRPAPSPPPSVFKKPRKPVSRLTTLQPTNIFPAKFQLICGANHFRKLDHQRKNKP